MELSWLPKRGSYYTNTFSKLYAMLEPLLVFYSFLPSLKQWPRGSFYRPWSLLVEGAHRGVKRSGGRQNGVAGSTPPGGRQGSMASATPG